MEAYGVGTPVIARSCGGRKEVCERFPYQKEVVLAENNAQDLSLVIKTFFKWNKSVNREILFNFASANFDVKNTAGQMADYFRKFYS
jgi:glycosyltransferase involved in cell wall biosynthesis